MTEAQQRCMKHTLRCEKTLELAVKNQEEEETLELVSCVRMGISDRSSLVQMCILKVAQNMDVLEKKVSSEFYLQQHFLLMPNQELICI